MHADIATSLGDLLVTDAGDAQRSNESARQPIAQGTQESAAQYAAARIEALECRNRDLELFVRALAHDSAAHIRGVALSLELLRERLGATGGEIRGMLDAMAERTTRLANLSEGLLRFARIDRCEIRRTATDLSTLAERIAFALHAQTPERPARFDIEPGMSAECDAALVELVLDNLLGNAWKFSAQAPITRIAFGRRKHDSVYYVSDNGIGFGCDDRAALFEPFVRLRSAQAFAGNGLGLATVKRVIERHGGWIRAESIPGQGATFLFTLAPGAVR